MKLTTTPRFPPRTASRATTIVQWTLLPLALCIGLPVATAASKDGATDAALELHKKGQYQNAATRGLSDLLSQPWNHELRFIVADSLQRIGKTDEAAVQLEALEGTALADTATARLNAMRKLGQTASLEPAAPARMGTTSSSPSPMPSAAPTAQVAPAYVIRQLAQAQIVTPTGTAVVIEKQQPLGITPLGRAAATPVPSPVTAAAGPKRSPAAQRVADLNSAENYQATGSDGLVLLKTEQPDEELQLIIANSLAWTGRLNEAAVVYQGLAKGKYSKEATIGLANVQRWSGRDDQAVPLYRAVLAADPSNAGAQEGLALALRELRPRTTLNAGASTDSSEMQRRSATLNHRWRDAGGNIIEVETSGVRDRLPTAAASQADLTVRYQAPTLALKPALELSVPNKAGHTLYGSARVKVSDTLNVVEIGRVNWGKIATNPNALESHLAANHVGLEATQGTSLGNVVGRLDYFDISDGNSIVTGSVRLASNWRPLGPNVKPFVGVEMRDAKFNTPNYWSPAQGFGSFYAGLLAEWGSADWNFYASGQAGLRLYGDAGTSWSLSAGGKRWVTSDVAVGMNLWSMASQRDNAAYRAKSVNVNLEKLW